MVTHTRGSLCLLAAYRKAYVNSINLLIWASILLGFSTFEINRVLDENTDRISNTVLNNKFTRWQKHSKIVTKDHIWVNSIIIINNYCLYHFISFFCIQFFCHQSLIAKLFLFGSLSQWVNSIIIKNWAQSCFPFPTFAVKDKIKNLCILTLLLLFFLNYVKKYT